MLTNGPTCTVGMQLSSKMGVVGGAGSVGGVSAPSVT